MSACRVEGEGVNAPVRVLSYASIKNGVRNLVGCKGLGVKGGR